MVDATRKSQSFDFSFGLAPAPPPRKSQQDRQQDSWPASKGPATSDDVPYSESRDIAAPLRPLHALIGVAMKSMENIAGVLERRSLR